MPTATLSVSDENSKVAPVIERRRSERRPYVIEAWVCLPTESGEDQRIEVISMDLSRHGVGLAVPVELTPGQFHVVEIGFGSQRLIAEIRVVSCRLLELGEGLFQIGAEFC